MLGEVPQGRGRGLLSKRGPTFGGCRTRKAQTAAVEGSIGGEATVDGAAGAGVCLGGGACLTLSMCAAARPGPGMGDPPPQKKTTNPY